ncbi:MAG TPA: hypothetical protein VGG45_04490 [Terracidiphilus sp.]|jgi:hypothetical protein
MSIESGRLLVLGMNGKRADSDEIGNLKRSSQRIEQQAGSKSTALRFCMNGQPGKDQQRDRMARHAPYDALGGIGMSNLAGNHAVEAENLTAVDGDVGLRRICLLRLQRVPYQKTVKLRLSAAKCVDDMDAL